MALQQETDSAPTRSASNLALLVRGRCSDATDARVKLAPLSGSLADEIEEQLSISVHQEQTNGSLENLLFLQSGMADFGLYQPGTLDLFEELDPNAVEQAKSVFSTLIETASVSVVANAYSQPAHFIVRRDAGISSPADLTESVASPAR